MTIPERDLAKIRNKFSPAEFDYDRALAELAAECASGAVKRPIGLLVSWLKAGRFRVGADEIPASQRGMLRRDGSWSESGQGDADLHSFVDSLVTARRRGYDPARVAERILREPDWEAWAPNARTWLTVRFWALCPCSTSAEAAVKYAGRGSGPNALRRSRNDDDVVDPWLDGSPKNTSGAPAW